MTTVNTMVVMRTDFFMKSSSFVESKTISDYFLSHRSDEGKINTTRQK